MLTQLRRLIVVAVAMGIGTRAAFPQGNDTSLPAVTIESGQAQLFVDDYLIAAQNNLERTLRQPKKDNDGNEPVIAIDDEFGETKSTLEANGTILYDPRLKKWVMFALAFASNWPGESADRVRLYRFTSDDAMNWVKGDDGMAQRIAIDLYDPASKTSATNIDLFSCTYDEKDTGNPYKGWLFFANWGAGREGTYYVQSPDGIHWTRGPQVLVAGSRSIEQDGRKMNGTGDVTTFYHDKEQNRFLGCLRFASATDVENTNRLRSRGFIFTDRLDRPIDLGQVARLNLIPQAAERHGDMPTDEYYSSTAWRHGSLWLGGLRVWHSRDDYPYSAAGSAFMKLLVSRDGLHWKKVPFKNDEGFFEVFLPNGKEGGNDARNDGGYMTEFSHAPLRIGEELIYYYGSSSWGKNHPRPYRVSGGGIFRARLRPDGFVSVDRGSLITRRLKFDGRDLYVNGVGPITIEVVTLAENTVTKIAQATIGGDSLDHKVVFDDRQSLGDVADKGMAQLRFTVGEGGALYSFTIDPSRSEVSSTAKGQPLAKRCVVLAEHPDEDYYDPELPKTSSAISIKPFEGERYEAEVPDTLDLAYHAGEALNFLTRCIAPDSKDLCIFHLMHGQFNPCIFEIGHGSNQNQNAKWTESVVMMRAMTGSGWNTEGDQKLMSSLVRFTGPDGLFYVPVKDRPWAYIDPVTQKIGKPFADAFAEGRQLRALATWYQHDRNPMWKEIADRKVKRLLELAIRKDDTLYFKLARGYSPWYVENGEGPVAALGDVGQVFDSLTGDAAANMICWMPQAAATWYKVTGNTDALTLARGLARYLYKDEVFFDRKKGRFHNYGTFFTHAMNSICSYALVAEDQEMIDWVKLGLDQFLEQNDPDRTGMMMMHACDYADMMQVMCMLGRSGHGDYWEDIDRWIRNGFDWRQITREDVAGMNNRPVTRMGDLKTTATLGSLAYWVKGELPLSKNWPHLLQPDDGNERVRGACGGAGCCQGNLTRALYLCWDSILEAEGDDRLKVNLLLNRASPWADVNSWIPCEGKAVIHMKKPVNQVLVRVAQWADRKQLVCKVDGKERPLDWADKNYLNAGSMKGGEEILLEFPINEVTKETRMKVAGGNRLGTLKIDYLAVSKVADDFTGAAGKLDAPGAGSNTGAGGMTWRWNAGMTPPVLDGQGSLELPVTGNWNQYIDSVSMPPFVLGGQDATFVAIFQKSGAGDVAMGFIRDLTWDGGDQPKGQRLFKIKDNRIYVSNRYESDKTDEDTGVAIQPDKLQGLMIKKDAKGNVTWFYQDGGEKDSASAAWKNITLQTSAVGNLESFNIDLGHIGINGLGEGTKKSTVTTKGNTVVAISENILGYPIDKHAKYRKNKAGMKNVRRFATSERFVWY